MDRLRTWMIAASALAITLAPSAAPSAVTPSRPSPQWPAPADRGENILRSTALKLHNDARQRFGVAPVAWSESLAAEARGYAESMARSGVYQHDQTPGRRKRAGENLWRGSRGVFAYDVMVGLMVDEVRDFRPGVFPAVSATGQWSDVAHFTQIVWPTTTEIGCGLATSASQDYLVCRYAPTGNKDGVALVPRWQVAAR